MWSFFAAAVFVVVGLFVSRIKSRHIIEFHMYIFMVGDFGLGFSIIYRLYGSWILIRFIIANWIN